jgi:hypothetical protein
VALDTAQKRGSAMCLKSPWRRWLSEPHGTDLDYGDRLSVLHMCSAIGDTTGEPTDAGLEFTVHDSRQHFTVQDSRHHFTIAEHT